MPIGRAGNPTVRVRKRSYRSKKSANCRTTVWRPTPPLHSRQWSRCLALQHRQLRGIHLLLLCRRACRPRRWPRTRGRESTADPRSIGAASSTMAPSSSKTRAARSAISQVSLSNWQTQAARIRAPFVLHIHRPAATLTGPGTARLAL